MTLFKSPPAAPGLYRQDRRAQPAEDRKCYRKQEYNIDPPSLRQVELLASVSPAGSGAFIFNLNFLPES